MRRLIVLTAAGLLLAGCASLGGSRRNELFLVFFSANETTLIPASQRVVDAAAGAIKARTVRVVEIAGEPESINAAGYDPKLSEPRFRAVEAALTAAGVNPALFARAALTDEQAKIGSTNGGRRVEIRVISP